MKPITLCLLALLFLAAPVRAQSPEIKFIADTLVVQADGTYQADPDLATLTFDISTQDKTLKVTYDRASQAMQRIVALAQQNGLANADVSGGILTVTPYYGDDRKRRAKSFLVQGQVTLKIRDFAKLAALMDASVDETTELHSLTYSLADEEAAKQHAVAEAMRRALGRAKSALEQKGQNVGKLRFANLDVRQLPTYAVYTPGGYVQTIDVTSGAYSASSKKVSSPPPPLPAPEKITITATVQCAFQIQ
jgi:uncharacterized protein